MFAFLLNLNEVQQFVDRRHQLVIVAKDLAGVVEPEDLDFEMVLREARPYLGEVVGVYGEWTPLAQQSGLYPEPSDEDPWQFINVRVP